MHAPVNLFVARRLRSLRLSKGLTCRELARKAGIPAGTYSTYENGWALISLERLFRLVQALGTSIREVWPEEVPLHQNNGQGSQEAIEKALKQRAPEIPIESVLGITADAFGISRLGKPGQGEEERLAGAQAACAILGEELQIPRHEVAAALNMTRTDLNELARAYSALIQESPNSRFARRTARARRLLEKQSATSEGSKKEA